MGISHSYELGIA
ncbi:hypothetical protein MTR67_002877 [Solanum verrucosum]|nr:hypothetical protein MTR67_002877 [Solanum verrucosum]